MKGVVLCGGLGTRLGLITQRVTNKHCLPVYNTPMIIYPLRTLVKAGITDICIVTGGRYKGHILDLLGNGKEFGINYLTYEFQYGEGGIAEALSLCERFVESDNCCVILGDNVFETFDLKSIVNEFDKQNEPEVAMRIKTKPPKANLFLTNVKDPQRFGIAEIKNNKIINIEEKPAIPKTDLAVTGLYMYDNNVFDFIREIKPSQRNELEVTDLNNLYKERGKLSYTILNTFWSDAGTPDSLLSCSEWVKEKNKNA